MTQNVRLQNLRDFTVQIRNDADQIVGTGITVSADGKIATCAHVVKAAGLDPHKANGTELRVYYPQLRGGQEKNRKAKVSTCFTDYDDDLVLLQLSDGYSPLGLEDMPVLGKADLSRGDPFHSYGYRRLDIYPAGWSEGIIQGQVEPPPSRKLQADPVQLKSNQISDGMSGSAVLDTERNLIIGVVSEMWFSDQSMKDSDTAWAVDGHIIYKLASLAKVEGLFFQEESLALKPAPSPKVDIAESQSKAAPKSRFAWHNAPQPLEEWIGRTELLKALNGDWQNPNKHVTGLIGFGGEGKSSLARKWLDNLLNDPSQQQPDNVFWWGFYENRSVDEFLEAALNYLSGDKIDPRQVPSSSLRAQIIGAMLGAGRYLFVLDGLEVLQHQEGDQYGLLKSNDLRDLLTYFARPDNQSFCLITSRAPLLDLMEYTTYTHRDVDRLSEADGIALLKTLGVKPSPSGSPTGVLRNGQGEGSLAKVVSDWDGHALTISLLGSYLAEKYGGDITHLADIPIPTADEPRYERVHRVLRRYDDHLTVAEREFLKLFSAFRTPVHESAFNTVFRGKVGFWKKLFSLGKRKRLNKTLASLDNKSFNELIAHLVTYRIIHCDTTSQTYTAHPLVRNYYLAILTHGASTEQHDVHSRIKDYYLSIAGDTPQYPTLDDLKPLIEVVHHACQAGAYDEAFQLYWKKISHGTENVLMNKIGAYETELAIMLDFFPSNDTSQEPQINNSDSKGFVLNGIGLCLMTLGRLREVAPFYERGNAISVEPQAWHSASVTYQNLAGLHIYLGALDASAEAAHQALDFARRAEKKQAEFQALAKQGWVAHLLGNSEMADTTFEQAITLQREFHSTLHYLYAQRGILHADHLRRTGDSGYARRVTEANLRICELTHWIEDTSQCHRVLGDLDSDSGNHESARTHYESALKIARSISSRAVLIEALLARGRFYAKVAAQQQTSEVLETSEVSVEQAFTDLNEALNYAVEGGYRVYEADIRVALGWAYLANGEKEKAKQSAQRALQMSQEMGYHWGKVDGEEVMQRMKDE